MSICFLSPILQSDSLHMPTLIGCYLLKIFCPTAPWRRFVFSRLSQHQRSEIMKHFFYFVKHFFDYFLIYFFAFTKQQINLKTLSLNPSLNCRSRSAKKWNYEWMPFGCQFLFEDILTFPKQFVRVFWFILYFQLTTVRNVEHLSFATVSSMDRCQLFERLFPVVN